MKNVQEKKKLNEKSTVRIGRYELTFSHCSRATAIYGFSTFNDSSTR